MKVDLFDSAFAHVDKDNHGMAGVKPTHFEWERSGVTHASRPAVFTEDYIYAKGIESSNASYNIGWLIETREISPTRYERFSQISEHIDFVITHDSTLLRDYPEKTRFAPFGGCWIKADDRHIAKKTKLCSTIFSNKRFMPGHRIRHKIYDNFRSKNSVVDFYGTGCNKPIDKKDTATKDYAFQIVVENSYTPNYFTEKLLDCFAYGTIPIYYGCPNIGSFFNTGGIIEFNNKEELSDILNKISMDDIIIYKKAIIENLKLLEKYAIPEDWIYENILKDLR